VMIMKWWLEEFCSDWFVQFESDESLKKIFQKMIIQRARDERKNETVNNNTEIGFIWKSSRWDLG
jgi:hypothetical protein